MAELDQVVAKGIVLTPIAQEPTIITICGSMRFYEGMLKCASELTSQGHIVLMPHDANHDDDEHKRMLDALHLAKVDMSDQVVVVTDRSVYVGDSTRREMNYAYEKGLPVQMWMEV